jgi:hypothetical protein
VHGRLSCKCRREPAPATHFIQEDELFLNPKFFREVTQCSRCHLTQFFPASGLCRRCRLLLYVTIPIREFGRGREGCC